MTAQARSFHVSNGGDDRRSGTSPESAWRSIPRVQQAIDRGEVRRGDAVLLHSGHRFHGQFTDFSALQGEGRLTFGAYGAGERPQLVGYKVLGDPAVWRNLGRNRWQVQLDDLATHGGNHSTRDVNVGLIEVNSELHGERRASVDELRGEWDWHSDLDAGTLTVVCHTNPSRVGEVRVAVDGRLFQAADDMTIQGLDLVGCGGHGIQTEDVSGVRVQGNRIRNIGGSELTTFHVPGVRYGNGVEVWINSHDVLVEGNVIHDVYDVAVTLQGEQVVEPTGADPLLRHGWTDVHVRDNRISRCSQSFEIWCRSQVIRDGDVERVLTHDGEGGGFVRCTFSGNHCTDAGVGWGYRVRPNKDEAGVHLLSYSEELPMDLRITGNRFLDAHNAYIYRLPDGPTGLVIDDNEIRLRPAQRIQQQPRRPETFPEHEAWARATGFDLNSTWLEG